MKISFLIFFLTIEHFNSRPLSEAKVKYRKSTDKKMGQNTEKIHLNTEKFIEIQNVLHLFKGKVIREFFKSILDNLHHNISVHIYDSKISVIATNYSFIHRSSEPTNNV